MNETEFVKAYVPAFLAAWAASKRCSQSELYTSGEIAQHMPIEDIVTEAKDVFKRACEVQPKYFQSTDTSPDA